MPTSKIRELIQETGIATFPKRKAISEDFLVMVSEKGAGMIYVYPKDSHTSARVMPLVIHPVQKPILESRTA